MEICDRAVITDGGGRQLGPEFEGFMSGSGSYIGRTSLRLGHQKHIHSCFITTELGVTWCCRPSFGLPPSPQLRSLLWTLLVMCFQTMRFLCMHAWLRFSVVTSCSIVCCPRLLLHERCSSTSQFCLCELLDTAQVLLLVRSWSTHLHCGHHVWSFMVEFPFLDQLWYWSFEVHVWWFG